MGQATVMTRRFTNRTACLFVCSLHKLHHYDTGADVHVRATGGILDALRCSRTVIIANGTRGLLRHRRMDIIPPIG
jgi:hypothetical protein